MNIILKILNYTFNIDIFQNESNKNKLPQNKILLKFCLKEINVLKTAI